MFPVSIFLSVLNSLKSSWYLSAFCLNPTFENVAGIAFSTPPVNPFINSEIGANSYLSFSSAGVTGGAAIGVGGAVVGVTSGAT